MDQRGSKGFTIKSNDLTVGRRKLRLNISRTLVGCVVFFNLQCAAVFLIFPEKYSSGFDLAGSTGAAIVQGFGLLFLMWNVPYIFALIHPLQNWIALVESIIMQLIGFVGESFLLWNGSSQLPAILKATVSRFIVFDGIGLVLLLLAIWIIRPIRYNSSGITTTKPLGERNG
jgi:hypothetical protein